MRKFASRILILSLIFASAILGLNACGDPYKGLKMEVSSPEVTYNMALGRNEFVLSSSGTIITLEAKVTGGDASIDRRVDISLEQPTEVLEPYDIDDSSAQSSGITSARFVAKNGGYATVKCVSREGGLVQTYKVFVVVPIEHVSFVASEVPIVKGQTTDIANSLANENTLYDYIKFTPGNTNLEDTLEFVFDGEAPEGVSIQGTKISVANSCTQSTFNVKAKYKDINGKEKETEFITFRVLTPFDVNKVKAFNQFVSGAGSLSETEAKQDEQNKYLYHLKLSTNLNKDYESSYQAFLAFKYEEVLGSGDYNKNILYPADYNFNDPFSYGTEYSITCESELKSNTVTSYSQVLEIKRTNAYNFNIVHKNYAITADVKFFVNFKGYEEFFNDTVITVRVEVLAFPEEISVAESEAGAIRGEQISNVSVYTEYGSGLKGTPLYVSVLGPDSQELNMEKFTAKIYDDNGCLELLVKRGASYVSISDSTELQSGTELFLRIKQDAGDVNITQARVVFSAVLNKEFSDGKVEKEIIVNILTEAVKWNSATGNANAEIFMNYTKANTYNFVFTEFVEPTWIDDDGNKKLVYGSLKASDFEVSSGNSEIVLVGNIDDALNSIQISNARNKLGTTEIKITTPNGFVLTIKVSVIINLTEESLELSFDNHIEDINITPADDPIKEFTALVGDKQQFSIYHIDESTGFKYKLGYNNGYSFILSKSSNPRSVRVDNNNEVVAVNASTVENQPLVTIQIDGYSWEGDDEVSRVAPKVKTFEFKFNVLVLTTVDSISLDKTATAIFTKETLNVHRDESIPDSLSEFDAKGKTTIKLSINPSNVTTDREIYWQLYRDLDGGFIGNSKILIGDDNRKGSIEYSSHSIALIVFYEVSEDLTSLTLYAELKNDADKSKTLPANIYAFAYVQETYTDLYGSTYVRNYSRHARVSVSNAILVNEIIPEVAFNTISFDKRDMVVDDARTTEKRTYFDQEDPNSCIEFSYKLNPINPENKKIIAGTNDSSIRAEVDCEAQKVRVYVDSILNDKTPVFKLYLYSTDSQGQDKNSSTTFSCFVVLTVKVQDGLNVPFEIANEDDLKMLASHPETLGYNYVLTQDITLKDEWTPIGTMENPFTGSFNGANTLEDGVVIQHTINNLVANLYEETNYFGFFGVTKDATLLNIKINQVAVKVSLEDITNEISVGSLVGLAINTKISNSNVSVGNDLINLNGAKIAAIKNSAYGITFETSHTEEAVVSIGGLVGTMLGGIVEDSSSSMRINYNPKAATSLIVYAGGMVGYLTSSNEKYLDKDGKEAIDKGVSNIRFEEGNSVQGYDVVSYILVSNKDYISSTQASAFGGVVGLNNGLIQGGKFRSIIDGQDNIGGIAGINLNGIKNSIVSPTLIGNKNIGGAVGINASGMLNYNNKALGIPAIAAYVYDEANKVYSQEIKDAHLGVAVIEQTKVQFLDYADRYSYFNTAIAGVDSLGGLIGLNIQACENNTFTSGFAYNSVYSYTSAEMKISANYDSGNSQSLYYGDIVLIGQGAGQAVGGFVGSANNLALTHSYAFVNINQNNKGSKVYPAAIGGALGNILPNAGNILLSDLNIKGSVSYIVKEDDKDKYVLTASGYSIGGFIGDATNIKDRLQFKTENGAVAFSYVEPAGFKVGEENYPFYNIQSSYTLLRFYNGSTLDAYVQNFAGKNESKEVTLNYTDKYTFNLLYDNSEAKTKLNNFIGEYTENISEDEFISNDALIGIYNDLGLIVNGSTTSFSSIDECEALIYRVAISAFNGITGKKTTSYYYYTNWTNIPQFLTNGKNGTQNSYDPYELIQSGQGEYLKPVVLASNSYYIGFEAYFRNAENHVSENKITIDEDLARGGTTDFAYYKQDINGSYVLYIANDGSIKWFEADSNLSQVNAFGQSGTGYYELPNGMLLSAEDLEERRYTLSTGSIRGVSIYGNWFYDNINNVLSVAGLYASENPWELLIIGNIDSNTGWNESGKPEDLEKYNEYLNNGVNDGYPILLSKDKENKGKVEFIVSLPPKSIDVKYDYSHENAYQGESEEIGEVKTEMGVTSQEITLTKVEDYITLAYYSVDTTYLPEILGYYDFNHDGSMEATQNERIYTAHVKAIIREKNRYALADIVTFISEPAFLNVEDLTVTTSSTLIEIEYTADGIYIVLLGSGKVKIDIYSNLNRDIKQEVYINVINKVSGLEFFSDAALLKEVTDSSVFKIVKGYDKKLYIKTEEYLDGINAGLTSLYGNVPLAKNSAFNIGVRYYWVTETLDGDLTIYHDINSVPAGFTANGLPFKWVEKDGKYLIYVDVDSASSVTFYGLEKSAYKLMAIPYMFEKADGDKTLLYKGELNHNSGNLLGIEIIDGTFGITSSIDSNTDPFKPINFETTIITDNVDAKTYVSVEKVDEKSTSYMEIKNLSKVSELLGVESIDIFKDSNGKVINVSNVNIYELPTELLTFSFDKFQVKITSIHYFDENNNIIEDIEEDRNLLKYIKYTFQVSVAEEYLYHINDIENFAFKFYTVKTAGVSSESEQVVETSFAYNITPQEVENVDLYHYADIQLQTTDISTGQQTVITSVNQDFVSNTLVCGEPGLLHINVHPGYSSVEYVEISSTSKNGFKVDLEQMYANYIQNTNESLADKYIFNGTYTALPKLENISINNGLGIKLLPYSYGYIRSGETNYDYNGNFYVKTSIPTLYDATIVFTLTIKGFADGKEVFSEELNITPQLKPEVEFHVNGKTEVPVAIGTQVEITLKSDGIIDESRKFTIIPDADIEELKDASQETLRQRYIIDLSAKQSETGKYLLKIPFNEDIIGEVFYLEVLAYKDVNNNRYETIKRIAIKPSLYVVEDILVDNVEYGEDERAFLKGNYNQDYALKVLVDATYCKDTKLINQALKAGADDDFATPKIKEIMREVEKLQATLSSYGLYGEYKCLDEKVVIEQKEQYVYDSDIVMEWQAEANKFGETEILLEDMKTLEVWEDEIKDSEGNYVSTNEFGYVRYSSNSWYVVEGNVERPVSVDASYRGIAIDNGRAEYLTTDRFVGTNGIGYVLREPYATLNVRVTDINTTTILKFQAEIDYGIGYGATGVGIKKDGIYSGFASHFETEFGFDALQLANEENPEPIYTTEEFKGMSSGGHYILMEDIELDMWEPLSTEIASFDGNGYVIRLNSFNEFAENSERNIGIFGTVGASTVLKNIIVEIPPANRVFDETKELTSLTEGDLVIRVPNMAGVKFGVIAGQNSGTITNAIVINNADSYREERDMLLFNNGSNGKITQTELNERRRKYYSTYINNNILALDSNRTSTIISVIEYGTEGLGGNTDSSDIRIGGFVGLNSGFITNSSVENISLISSYYVAGFACENDNNGKISSSYFKGGNIVNVNIGSSSGYSNNGTAGFAVINGGEINYSYVYGREIGADLNISGIDETTVDKSASQSGSSVRYVDRYVGLKYTYSDLTNNRDKEFNEYMAENDQTLDMTFNMRALGTVVKSVGTATGFVYNNSGKITNSYSNIFVMADASSGFVYVNDSAATIQNSFTLSSVQNMDTDHTAFSGVTYESGSFVDLGQGTIENCYYLKVNAEDYQKLYKIFNEIEDEELKNKLQNEGPFTGTTTTQDGFDAIVNSEENWVDKFSDSSEKALPLSAIEFASYTSFVSFSFNSDYSLNGVFDADVEGSGEENLARAVWFIPEVDDNESNENKAISDYFKHSSYVARVPQLVSANLKSMSLRYANFIKPLPADSSMTAVLETLKDKMGYARIATVLKGITTKDGKGEPVLKSNWDIIKAVMLSDPENPYAVGYAKELGEAFINAYLEVKNVPQNKWPAISGTNTIENQINTYLGETTASLKANGVNEKDLLDILVVAVNAMNAITEDSEASYSYSYIQRNMKGVDINYGKSVLNPYLVSSAEKFNTYTLQINSLGEITETEQGASLRLIKDIAFDNVIQTAKTYKANFFGDFEGNGLTINDLKIVAEDNPDVKQAVSEGIQHLGLFGTIVSNEETGEKANIRNLNIDIDAISATAVRYVGGLAGEITGGEVHNIRITGDEDALIEGFNATGGLAGKISGEKTLVSNIYNSVSIKSNYYSTPYNVYSETRDDTDHRFNLYVEPHNEIKDNNGVVIQKEILANINEVSYAGGIAGILEAREITSVGSEKAKINANIRSNTVTGDITIRGEVVGGLFGYVGKYSKIGNSTVKATSNLKLHASAIAGGLVGDLRGTITTSNVVNENQDAIDKIIYDSVYDDKRTGSSMGLDFNFENEAVAMYAGNAHYIGGIAGLSYDGTITYSFNRVDVASLRSKYAGGVAGLSIGLTLSNVYTTSSVNAFVAYGGLIGLQTTDNDGALLGSASQNNYHISNWDRITKEPDTTPISLSAVVAANLWKEEHKITNRKEYRIDAVRAQIGSFIGRAVSYNEVSPYSFTNKEGDFVWYNVESNPLSKRVKNESVFFMMDFAAGGDKIIYEIGNATSIKVTLNASDDEIETDYVENTNNKDLAYVVRNSTAYVAFENSTSIPTVYAYSGDFSSKIKAANGEGDENYKYYRFSRLQNYGSLRTIKEFIQGIYLKAETEVAGLTARIYDKNFDRYDKDGNYVADALNYNYIETNKNLSERAGEFAMSEILLDCSDKANLQTIKIVTNDQYSVNSQPQTIYNNWASDAWLGVEMDSLNAGFETRLNKNNYVFPKNRTKVFEDVIYVDDPWDLINNTESHPDATYIIIKDIDLDQINYGWEPLNTIDNPFTGTLESYGQYKLYDFSSSDGDGASFNTFGLFAYTKDAEFSNFNIEVGNLEITGEDSFGILAGVAEDSSFENISISSGLGSKISTNAKNVGGFVGRVSTNVKKSTMFTSCSANLNNFTIKNSSAKAGLFVGYNADILAIKKSAAVGIMNVSGQTEASIGGFVGESKVQTLLHNVYSSGFMMISSLKSSNVGGFVGKSNYTDIRAAGSKFEIEVRGGGATDSNLGGFVGAVESEYKVITIIQFAVSNTNIIASGSGNNVGGFVGKYNSDNADRIEDAYSAGTLDISGSDNNVGGLVGLIEEKTKEGFTILTSYSMSKINKSLTGSNVGGVVGSYMVNESEVGNYFEDALYVQDFVPESNGYGTYKTAYQFRTLSIEELGWKNKSLEDAGLVKKTEEPEEPDGGAEPDGKEEEPMMLWNAGGIDENNRTLSYPTMNIPFLVQTTLQSKGSNQVVAIVDEISNQVMLYESFYYTGSDLTPLSESLNYRVTIYLNPEVKQTANWISKQINDVSAVFGLNTSAKMINNGVISQSKLQEESNANGYFVQSFVQSSGSKPATLNKYKWFDSYVLYNDNSAVYYNTNGSAFEVTAQNEIIDFINAGFDFENIWTVYHIKDLETGEILLGFTPVLKWELTYKDFHGGDPTKDIKDLTEFSSISAYEVKTVEEYIDIVKAYNAGEKFANEFVTISIVADLDFKDKILTPIGTEKRPFKGTINGNDHTISGLMIVGGGNLGLIGYAGSGAKIENICIGDGVSPTGAIFGTNGSAVGALIGQVVDGDVTINNVQLYSYNENGFGRIEVLGDVAGAIVGLDNGKVSISNVAFEGYVYGNSIVGGFVGVHENLQDAMSIKYSYISNGNMTEANKENIFGNGIKGLLVGQIIGSENTSKRYIFNEVYVSTCKDLSTQYIGNAQKRIVVSFDNVAGFTSFDGMGNVLYKNYSSNYTEVENPDDFKTEDFGFSWGKVWTRMEGRNNTYPIFFDFWGNSTKIPDVPYVEGYSGKIVNGEWSNVETKFLEEVSNGDKIIEIDEAAELSWIARAVNLGGETFEGYTIQLTGDIYLENKGWQAIGTSEHPFKGTFVGGSHTINDIDAVGYNNSQYAGLFGYIEGATIQSLNLINGKVTGTEYLGSLVGYAKNSTIESISSNYIRINLISSEAQVSTVYLGGIVGYAEKSSLSTLHYGYSNEIYLNAANFNGLNTIYFGGIVGFMNGGAELLDLDSSIKLRIQAQDYECYIGGISGKVIGVEKIDDIEASGKINISANFGFVGGAIGQYLIQNPSEDIEISNITNYATIASSVQAGGIIGDVQIEAGSNNVKFANIKNEANVSVANIDNVAGVIGKLNVDALSLNMENIQNSGEIWGGNNVGGIAGSMIAQIQTSKILNISNSGSVSGSNCVGGLFGATILRNIESLEIGADGVEPSLSNTGAIKGAGQTGGVFGTLGIDHGSQTEVSVSINNLKNAGVISYIANSNNIGGVFGEFYAVAENQISLNMFEIKNVYNLGEIAVDGANDANPASFGGIAGDLRIDYSADDAVLKLTNLNNSGAVDAAGAEYVAGIVGYIYSTTKVEAIDLVNSGKIAGTRYVAGLIGFSDIEKGLDIKSEFSSAVAETEKIYNLDEEGHIALGYELTYYYRTLNSGKILGSQYVGGFVGYLKHGNIQGMQEDKSIYMLVNEGEISAQGDEYSYVGGIVGSFNSEGFDTYHESESLGYAGKNNLTYLENRAKVSGNGYVGGIAGYAITNAKVLSNKGEVSGSMLVGGIAGNMLGFVDIVKNSADVYGERYAGGVVGKFEIKFEENAGITFFSKLLNFQSLGTALVPRDQTNVGSLIGAVLIQGDETGTTDYAFAEDIIYLGLDGSYSKLDDNGNEIGMVGNPLVIGNFIEGTEINLGGEGIPITNFGTIDGGNAVAGKYSESPQWTICYGGVENTVSVILADISLFA